MRVALCGLIVRICYNLPANYVIRQRVALCMVAELLNCPTSTIHFGLLIASCDCNITTSISHVGHRVAAAVKIARSDYVRLAQH